MIVNQYWMNFTKVDKNWFYAISVASSLIGVVGMTLNMFAIFFLLKKRSNKRSSGKLFLINLAISDILKIVFNIPFKTVSNYYQKWMFGNLGCQIYGFTGGLFGFVSISTMALMTVERFLIMKNPLFAFRNQKRIILRCITISWLYSLIWPTLQLFGRNGYVLEGMLTSCCFDYLSRDSYSRFVFIAMLFGGFLVPLFTILIFYSLLLYLFQSAKHALVYRFENVKPYQMTSFSNVYNGSYSERKIKSSLSYLTSEDVENKYYEMTLTSNARPLFSWSKKDKYFLNTIFVNDASMKNNFFIKREKKFVKSILLSVLLFCFSWFPYAIMVLYAQFGSNIYLYITPLSSTLPGLFAKVSVIFNPIVYILSNRECKTFFMKYVFHRSQRRN